MCYCIQKALASLLWPLLIVLRNNSRSISMILLLTSNTSLYFCIISIPFASLITFILSLCFIANVFLLIYLIACLCFYCKAL